jgi:DNA-binding NarL/FixJ family response regulator
VVNAELPTLSGCDLCRMIKTRSPAAKVCLVADVYTAELERLAWAAGATLFVVKPAPIELLSLSLRGSQAPPPLPSAG